MGDWKKGGGMGMGLRYSYSNGVRRADRVGKDGVGRARNRLVMMIDGTYL